MNSNLHRCLVLAVFLAPAAFTGCSRNEATTQQLTFPEVEQKLGQAFAGASGETGNAATVGLAALKSHDLPAAFDQFHGLAEQPGLTPDQRLAASSALVNVLNQAKAAADQGDAAAQEVLRRYRASK